VLVNSAIYPLLSAFKHSVVIRLDIREELLVAFGCM